MRTGIEFTGSPGDRLRLAALISVQSSPHKHDWRARIVLLSADGTGTSAIWHQRDHVCDGQACDLRLALARAVRGCRCCRLVAREGAPARHPQDRRGQDGGSDPSEPCSTAARRGAPDAAGAGKSGGACGLDRLVSGRHMALPRIAGGSSGCRTTRPLPKSCTMWSGFACHLPPMRWCCPSTSRHKYRRLTAHSPTCPLRPSLPLKTQPAPEERARAGHDT